METLLKKQDVMMAGFDKQKKLIEEKKTEKVD